MAVVEWETFVGTPDTSAHTGFLLAEDAALKTYLQGLTAPARSGEDPIDVPVWFRFPEGERRISYPAITIDFLDVVPDFTRWTSLYKVDVDNEVYTTDMETGEYVRRGLYQPSVSPTITTSEDFDAETMGVQVDPYLMHILTYQVSVWCRSALHDRYLTSRFLTDVFPPRPFFLPVDADMTYRRSELVQFDQADTMETTESGDKRIFRKVYTINVDAEIPQSQLLELAKINRIHIDVYKDIDGEREEVEHEYDAEHLIGSPVNIDPPPGP